MAEIRTSMSGCAAWKPSSRGMSHLVANTGATLRTNAPRRSCSRSASIARSSSAKPARRPGRNAWPASVRNSELPAATEEPDLEVVLQGLHLMADGGRGDAELVRGPGDAQVTARRLEGAERGEGR